MLNKIEKKINKVTENLRKNGFNVLNVETTDDAKQEILKMVKENEVIGAGGSLTIRELGVLEELMSRGNKVIHHWLPNTFIDEIKVARRKAVRISDVYLTSTNAITLDGHLVNVDTYGNRVAAMIYGPPKVIIVAGYNKIVKDIDDAFKRIREESTIKNAKRLNVEFPNGLCKVATIIYKRPNDTDITIILINMELGY